MLDIELDLGLGHCKKELQECTYLWQFFRDMLNKDIQGMDEFEAYCGTFLAKFYETRCRRLMAHAEKIFSEILAG